MEASTSSPTPTPTHQRPQMLLRNKKTFFKELKSQCDISIPTIIGLLFYKIPWMISLHFVGELGPEPLAAAALATTLCNVTGLSFSVGLSSAITTLTGQAKGHLLKQGHEMMIKKQITNDTDPSTNVNEVNDVNDDDDDDLSVSDSDKANDSDGDLSGTDNEEKKNENTPLLTKKQTNNRTTLNTTFPNDTDRKQNQVNDEQTTKSQLVAPLVYLYRGILIQLAIVIPIGLWWIHGIEPMLLYLGQAEKLSIMTTTYLRILTPGLWSYSINWTTTAWLQSIEMADVPAYAAFVGFLFHIPFNMLYVNVLGYGYEGVAMATVSFQLLQPIIIYFYLFGTNHGRDRILINTGAKAIGRNGFSFWPEFKAALFSFSGVKQYLGLGLPGMVAISEWWASEICIFLAGTLHPNPDYALGAMSIYQSINTFCFMFPIGFSTAASSRVGMFLGKNQPTQAFLASRISLLFAGLLSITMGMILFFTPHRTFPSLFTSDENVILQTSYTIPFLAFYVFADGLQSGFQGVIKGCGKQSIVAPVVIFSYWVVGVPLAYYNTFTRNDGVIDCDVGDLCGIQGLIFGLLTGTWIHMLLLFVVVMFAIDWRKEAALAQARMSLKDNEEDEEEEDGDNLLFA